MEARVKFSLQRLVQATHPSFDIRYRFRILKFSVFRGVYCIHGHAGGGGMSAVFIVYL